MDNITLVILFPNRTRLDDEIAGGILLSLSLFFLILYLPVVYCFITVKEFIKNPCYILMLSLAVSDCLALISWALLAIDILISFIPLLINSILMSVLIMQWRNMAMHQMLLAVNRYLCVRCKPSRYNELYSKPRLVIMISFSWVYAFLMCGMPSLLPPMTRFSSDGYHVRSPNANVRLFFEIDDEIQSPLLMIMGLICYGLILRNYHKARQRVLNHGQNQNGWVGQSGAEVGQGRRSSVLTNIPKFRLAWQMFAVTGFFAAEEIGFYICNFAGVDGVWAYFILATLLWAINSGVAPAIYLIFNRELQVQLIKKLKGEEI